ncbi:DUF4345 domain-containing protein [Winogradskyella sp.]|uniref:DUF4345 domain-containing protein n=1 Tax=Winogradskyella sp. TaxID=1883156 RepID=UPI0025E3E13F|nr:DUF4345 domain-containing protein [Winogradskyella sp.]
MWISMPIVLGAGLCYGFFADAFLEISPNTVDEHNFNKAIMGLYLGAVILWCIGLFKPSYFKLALMSHIFFMLPMALGRLLSMVLDGVPSNLYLYGTIGEFVLGVYGIWVLSIYYKKL